MKFSSNTAARGLPVPSGKNARQRSVHPSGRTSKPHRPLVALATLVLTATASAVPTAATGAPTESDVLLIGQTKGCTEIGYTRTGLESAVRPLVPERYALVPAFTPPGTPARVTLGVNEWTCSVQTTDDGRRTTRQRDVAGVLVFAEIQTADGQPADGVYGLLLATEDKAERSAFVAAGWPADKLSKKSTVKERTSPGGLLQATFDIRGGGWRHTIEGASFLKFPESVPSRAAVLRDSGNHELRLCFENEGATISGVVTGDQTGTPFAELTPVPPLYAGFAAQLANGGWRSTLTQGDCPTTFTGAKSPPAPWWKPRPQDLAPESGATAPTAQH